MSRASQPSFRAPTLCILADWWEGEYQSAVVAGAVDAAREAGANLLLVAGIHEGTTLRLGERYNVVYELARSQSVDGLVVMPGSTGSEIGLDALARYCERYRPRPMCSISAKVEGMTGILVDALPALGEAISHLLEDHRYRQLAFIGGPPDNLEALGRLRKYTEVLTAHGLPPAESHIVSGDFRYEAGVDAVHLLLDERGLELDAIVAATDSLALGAIDALRTRNVRVPRDVAVIGFDDITEARFSAPPLTTVRQPLWDQGRVAVEVLLGRLRGEKVDDTLVLPAELVVRRSCGCYSDVRRRVEAVDYPAAPADGGAQVSAYEALLLRRTRILEVMRVSVSGLPDRLPEGWAAGLFDALVADLRGPSNSFTERLAELAKPMAYPVATGNPWQVMLTQLHRELLPCLASEPLRSRAEELLDQAQVLAAEAVEDAQVQRRLTVERRRRSLSVAAELLSAAFDLDSLALALRDSMPRLGIPSAFLVLDEGVSSVGARMIFAYDPGRDPSVLDRLCESPIETGLLPEGLIPVDRIYTAVVEPLIFKDDPLGYAVFEMRPKDAFVYDAFGALRTRISGALKVVLLVEELQVRAGQLRQAQKMETLGQLSGAIAHDFNNLLQAIRGYAELAELAEPGSEQQAADMAEIVRAADRASELTRQLLTFSQPTRANARVVDLNDCVGEALPLIGRLLGPAIQISVALGPDAGSIAIDAAQFEQALLNLCVNSRDAMPEGGSLTIETGRRSVAPQTNHHAPQASAVAAAFVAVSDTGLGIAPEIKERIFEPFFTTKEAGQGTGLGLSIVYGIVHSASGEVLVESDPGRGTRVILTFPTAEAAPQDAKRPDEPRVRGTETILLVEDEEAIRKLAERVLGEAGYRVLSAANAPHARELWAANQGRVELLLTDVTMPGQSGTAFAAELAQSGGPPRTLFISGRLPGQPGGPTLPDGAAFLPKPFSVSALLDAVRTVLDTHGGDPSSA